MAREHTLFTKCIFSAVCIALGLLACALPGSSARAANAPDGAHATRLILLGTAAGPGVVRQRSEPASLIVVDGTPYLIDAGQGVSRQLVRAGFRVTDARTIFISHHHVDHNAGLPALISLDWFAMSLAPEPPAPIQIYGPPATEFLVKTALDYLSVSERIFSAGIPHMLPSKGMFEAHDISDEGVVYQDAHVKVTAAENSHFSFKSGTAKTGQDRSYAYRFDTANGSIVFTGDTGPSDAVIKLARGADVLLSEVRAVVPPPQPPADAPSAPRPVIAELINHVEKEHLTPDEVGKMAARAHVKLVVLTHVSPSTDMDATKFTAGVKKYFSGSVIPGKDLLEYDLD